MRLANRHRMPAVVLLGTLALAACGDGSDTPTEYPERTTPTIALENVVRAWNERNVDQYGSIVATDFQFYLAPEVRDEIGTVLWTRSQEIQAVAPLFTSPEVSYIDLNMPVPAGATPGPNGWLCFEITQYVLEVEIRPLGDPEPTYFQVSDDRQTFCFRRGKNPTDAADSTSVSFAHYYLVEWRDAGDGFAARRLGLTGEDPAAATPAESGPLVSTKSWSSIKTLFR